MVRDVGARRERPAQRQGRRAQRLPDQPDGRLGHPVQQRQVDDAARGRPLPAQPLHVRPPHRALSELTTSTRPAARVLHGAARAHQHAAPGPDTLNDPAFFEAAQALADRMLARRRPRARGASRSTASAWPRAAAEARSSWTTWLSFAAEQHAHFEAQPARPRTEARRCRERPPGPWWRTCC